MPDLLTMVVIVLTLVVLLVLGQTVVLLGVVRRLGESSSPDTHQANPTQLAPDFVASELSGGVFSSQSLVGKPRMFLFVSPMCRSCSETLERIGLLKDVVGGNVVIVCQGDVHECAMLATRHGLDVPIVVDTDRRVSDMHGVGAVPTVITVQGIREITYHGGPPFDSTKAHRYP